MEIIQNILKWPVIIQGALGSFLFWIILMVGQKLFRLVSDKLKADTDTAHYFGKAARDELHQGNFTISQICFLNSLYGALHYFLKAILVICVAALFWGYIPVFGIVGLLFGVYFLFRSLSYVPHFSSLGPIPNKEDADTSKS